MRIGAIKKKDDIHIASCSCKTLKILPEGSIYQKVTCDNCGNEQFVSLENDRRVVIPYLDLLKSDRRGFKVKRTNISIGMDNEYNLMIKKNMIQVLIFDMINKEFKLYKNGEKVEMPKLPEYNDDNWRVDRYSYQIRAKNKYKAVASILGRNFFRGVNEHEFRDMVVNPENNVILSFIYRRSYDYTMGWHDSRLYRGLLKFKMDGLDYIEILANAGFKNISRLHGKNIANRNGKNPSEILGVPKSIIKYIKDSNLSAHDINRIHNILRDVDANKVRELIEIAVDEGKLETFVHCFDEIRVLYKEFKYNNLKKLALYALREARMYQGITHPNDVITYLKDYVKMCKDMGIDHEKYPKSLKKDHDIVAMNYKVMKDEIENKKFIEAVENEEYSQLLWKGSEYSVIYPKNIDDLIKEGDDLSHCVASYVDSIISKSCKILFLRHNDEIDKSLGTIEVRGDRIRQARGKGNRPLNIEERRAIEKWAKEKELTVNLY
ncbi:PcfJ domain-containing protein [Bacillus velezensis]|uniref:PcfJ domain-containing protein n=1 Tax=Bacillus velezensis TaxID=492670 RepID=UPI0018C5E634|nr:PcfJ domain-containing protein [Bacillus velezensis]QPK89880.1 PcfJ domain-containing protein [Bacillus velezensis]